MATEAESLETKEPLGLDALARVEAADQDDIPLDEVLCELNVEEPAWLSARPSLIMQASENASAFKSYQAALESAQDGYHRSVEPLYDDVEAWVAYSLALSTPAGTASLLSEKGLTLGDLARLERHWRQRMQRDPSVAKQAKEAKQTVVGKPLPDIVIGPRQAANPANESPTTSPADTAPVLETAAPDLYEQAERAAVLKALLGQKDAAEALRQRGVASVAEAEAEVERVVALLNDDPVMHGFFRRRVDHVRGLLERAPNGRAQLGASGAPLVPVPAPTTTPARAEGPSELDVTGPIDFQRLGLDSLPFDPNAQAAPLAPVVAEVHPEVGATAFVDASSLGLDELARSDPAAQSVDETGFLDPTVLGVQGASLPFDDRAPVQVAPVPEEAHPEAGATAFIDAASLGIPSQPFDAEEQSVDSTGFLDPSTLGDLDHPLPFHEDGPVSAPGKVSLLPHRAMGETKLQTQGAVAPPSTPFPTGEAHRPPDELLSNVRRYASYRVDLLRAPHETAKTRARYGVANDHAHADLVATFDARFTADPRLADEYQEAVRTYSAWLNGNGGTRG